MSDHKNALEWDNSRRRRRNDDDDNDDDGDDEDEADDDANNADRGDCGSAGECSSLLGN